MTVDNVRNPKHYQILDGVESIAIIVSAMSMEAWHGYCLGNIIKYRLRAGNKDALEQDIGKADYYKELYLKHKHLCNNYEQQKIATHDIVHIDILNIKGDA